MNFRRPVLLAQGSSQGEEALYYASILQVLAAAKEDQEVMKILVETAIETEKEVVKPLMLWSHNGVPAGNEWNRSVNNAIWGFDYLNAHCLC